ncbi:MAG: ABC transporter permease subunit [Clostridia bacterium]|nr:ABC transporter permease subunit [Clostridia bacterium]
MIKKVFKKTAAVAFWIAVWQLLSFIVSTPLLLPGPLDVVRCIAKMCMTGEFWLTILMSFGRITLGIVISLVLGILLGVISSASELADVLISPVMSLAKATPVASFIMLALLWMSRELLPVFITVLIVVPVVTSNVRAGISSVDKKLLEVTRVFKFSFVKTVKRLYVPSVYPYFISACRSSLGLGWKAGIAAEVLAVPALSIGKMIYESKLTLETTELFAWTLAVILLSVLIEYVFCYAFKRMGNSYERRVSDNAQA